MEKEFLRWLTHSVPADERIPLGIGDDAAILAGCEDGVVVADVRNERFMIFIYFKDS